LVLIIAPTLVGAMTAAEASTPAGAEMLAADIHSSFWKEIDVRLPPFRTVIAEWKVVGSSSYLAEVHIYDLLYGASPRRALVLAACWSPGRAFSGGWLDVPGNEAELRSEFEAATAGC
jgi:hypothetical protein